MRNKFTDRVSQLIQNKNARKIITAELESHILDKADYYEELGYSREVAMQRATEEMGDPDDTAVPLNALHKSSAFKNILTVLSALLAVALFLLGNMYCDSFGYANNNLDHPHFVKFDFLSLAIFAGYVLLLYIARKRKVKSIATAVVYSLILQTLLTITTRTLFQEGVFVSDVTTLFQPLAYALVMIVTSGFSGYTDSIFSYSFIALPPSGTAIYKGIAIALFVFLIVWAVAVYVEISRQEKMKPTKRFRKPLKYSHYIVAVLLFLNFIVMSVGTAIAYNDLDYKINETQTVREHMIDCLLNADKSADYEEQLNYFKQSGYNATQDIRFDLHDTTEQPYIFLYNSNMISLSGDSIDNYFYSVKVSATTSRDSIVEKALLCDSTDREQLSSYSYGANLDDFIHSGIYKKAYEVERTFEDNSDYDDEVIPDYSDRIYFNFRFDESADYEYYMVKFQDGVLVKNTAIDNVIQVKYKRKQIIDCITEEMYGTDIYEMQNDFFDRILDKKVSDFENLGISMYTLDEACTGFYGKADESNTVYLFEDYESGECYFQFCSDTIEDYDNVLNDKMYFTKKDYDKFERGMAFDDFIKPENNYYYSNAACVIFHAFFDEIEAKYTQKDITYYYAVKEEGRLSKFYLKFENGELVDKNLVGNFSEVDDYMEMFFPEPYVSP